MKFDVMKFLAGLTEEDRAGIQKVLKDTEEKAEAADAKIADLTKRLEAKEKAEPGPYDGLPAEVVKRMKDAEDRAAELQKRIDAAEEREAERAAILKAEKAYPHLNIEPAALGKMLRKVERSCEAEEVEKLTECLKSADAAAKASAAILKTYGRTVPGTEPDESKSADAKLTKMAKDRAAKEGTTWQQAYITVTEENPDLYRAAMKGE